KLHKQEQEELKKLQEERQMAANAPCMLESPESCSAIRAAILEGGVLKFSDNSQTANVQAAFDLAKSENQAAKTNENGVISYASRIDADDQVKKLVVIAASQNESAPLDKLMLDAKLQSFSNIRTMKYVISENKDEAAAAKRFDIKDDETVLIVYLANNSVLGTKVSNVLKKAKVNAQKIKTYMLTEAPDAYQIENSALQIVGTTVYLHYILPEKASEIDLTTVTLKAGTELAKRDSDFDVDSSGDNAKVRILKPSNILKNVKDVVKISYTLKKTSTEQKPADQTAKPE
ncbi:MAG: hypothetical protein AABZ31_03215, partial [Bdellovibrionota bacterium]